MRHRYGSVFLAAVAFSTLVVVFASPRHHHGPRYETVSYMQPEVIATEASSRRPTPEDYNSIRDLFVRYEDSKMLGSDVELNERELLANQRIMELKSKEYEEGLVTPHLFKPSQHIFSVLEQMRASPLYEILSLMPKGGVLHAHDTALCRTEFLMELTYRANLWACQGNKFFEIAALRFARRQPNITRGDCSWELLSQIRQTKGATAVDELLAEHMTLYPTEKFQDVNVAWEHFTSIFTLVDDILLYAPVWADYYYHALEEFHADGVQYLEVRSTLPTLYDLDGNEYAPLENMRIYKETLDKFMAANPNFIGSKIIYAPVRHADDTKMAEYIRICIEIKKNYPSFLAGFDLVGQEELGRPLKDFVPQLLTLPDSIDFFFHTGETNFYGSSVDENLIDAVLLGTKRVGHGFALVKHPAVLQTLKARNIAIEVCPISNQVLQLVADYRNHPCAHFFADNYPVVISSDDPSFWKAAPLSDDFYMAFLGIASAHADLRLLKKLAMNSIQYSALDATDKVAAMVKWQTQWDKFIERVVTGERNAAILRLEINLLD